MSTVIEDLTLVTPSLVTDVQRADRRCLCGVDPGRGGLLVRVVSVALPPGIDAVVVRTATWRVCRVALAQGYDPLTVPAFDHLLHPSEGEWLHVCRGSVYF